MPAATPWYVGVQVPLPFTLTDSTGAAQDASGGTGTVVATVTLPDGTTSTPAVTHVGAAGSGQYQALYTTTQAGHHIITWAVAGTTPGSYTDSFEVQAATDPTIVSLAEAKEILKLSTAQYDLQVQGHNAACTDVIEYYCGPVVQRTIIEELPSHGTEMFLSKPPVLQLLAWTVLPAQFSAQGITLPSPPSPMLRTRLYGLEYPLTQLHVDNERGIVTHTGGLPFIYCAYAWQYSAGRVIIPAGIYEAAKVILKHLYAVERGGQAGGTQAAYGESETTMTPLGFAIPNRAFEMMRPQMAASSMVAV
jgi:hypothetical protein